MGVCTVSPHSEFTASDPRFLTHLHQTWNTETIGFNCVCARLCYLCESMYTRKPMHVCAPFFPPVSAYMSFSTLYLLQGIIWCTGLDLVASNKLLFQCCLCIGPNHTQLCGWPPVSPQGKPYI